MGGRPKSAKNIFFALFEKVFEKVFAVIFQISRFSRSNSRYRGYRGQFPDIAIGTAKFPISRYRDDRELSVCLVRTQSIKQHLIICHAAMVVSHKRILLTSELKFGSRKQPCQFMLVPSLRPFHQQKQLCALTS